MYTNEPGRLLSAFAFPSHLGVLFSTHLSRVVSADFFLWPSKWALLKSWKFKLKEVTRKKSWARYIHQVCFEVAGAKFYFKNVSLWTHRFYLRCARFCCSFQMFSQSLRSKKEVVASCFATCTLAQCPATASNVQFDLLCCQPWPVPETLSTRTFHFTM